MGSQTTEVRPYFSISFILLIQYNPIKHQEQLKINLKMTYPKGKVMLCATAQSNFHVVIYCGAELICLWILHSIQIHEYKRIPRNRIAYRLSPAAFCLQSILPLNTCFIRISFWLCFLAETVKSSVSWQWTINTRNVSQLRGSWGDDCDCLPSPPTQLHRYPQNTTLLWQVSRIRKIKNNFCVFCLILKLLSYFTILQHDI